MIKVTEEMKVRYTKVARAINSNYELINDLQSEALALSLAPDIFKQTSLAKRIFVKLKCLLAAAGGYVAGKAAIVAAASIIEGGLTVKISGALFNASLCMLGGSMIGGVAVIGAIAGVAGVAIYKIIEGMEAKDRSDLEATVRLAALQIGKFCSAINLAGIEECTDFTSLVRIDNSATALICAVDLSQTMIANAVMTDGVQGNIYQLKDKAFHLSPVVQTIKDNLCTDPKIMGELAESATDMGLNKDFRSVSAPIEKAVRFNSMEAYRIRFAVPEIIDSLS